MAKARFLGRYIIRQAFRCIISIEKAKKFGFALVLMTVNFRPYQVISASAEANVHLRKNQYSLVGLDCAKLLLSNKIGNQRNLLVSVRNKTEEQKQAVKLMENYAENLLQATSLRQLMGVEGNSARVYFKAFFDNVDWKGRFPRVKPDMVNALLDMGYTLMFNFVDVILAIFGFDRYCGFCHVQFYMRKSLTCDVVEPFRCVIDKLVKKAINLGQFKQEDFDVKNGKWVLKREKNTDYVKVFVPAILKYKKQVYLYVRSLYRAFMKNTPRDNFPIWIWEE